MDIVGTLTQYVVPVIVVICLGVGWCIKHLVRSDRLDDFIPTVAALLGLAIAVWANAGQPLTPDVAAVGIASGLASTGLYEAVTHWLSALDQTGGDHAA